MTKIRLARFGSRHQPRYRIVVADSRSRRDGRFIEILGNYNPENGTVTVDKERASYWISVGAQPTNTTISLLTKGGVKHTFEVQKKPIKPQEEAPKEAETADTTDESADEPAGAETADTPEGAAEEASTDEQAA